MPVYEYGCAAGHRFEVKQKINDAPVSTCRVCDLPVSKLISPSAISFKGSGWYVTDYSDKLKPPATEEKSAKPGESKKDGAEKPAAASEGNSGGSGHTATPPAASTPAPAGGSASGSGSPASPPSES
jgi:putative FmdB family regulatory protein